MRWSIVISPSLEPNVPYLPLYALAIVLALLVVYLFYAVIHPERF